MNRTRYVPFERNRYFYGKLLTVRDFMAEQTYLADKRRLTNRLLFGSGVVAGLQVVAVDDKTIEYVKGRPFAPTGENWDKAVAWWKTLHSDPDAQFDAVVRIDAADIKPQVTWGTSPEMVLPVDAKIPNPFAEPDPVKQKSMIRALEYMGLQPGTPIQEIAIDKVFIGSCTNSRIEDLRAAAAVIKGRKKADSVKLAMVVPGSGLVKQQA